MQLVVTALGMAIMLPPERAAGVPASPHPVEVQQPDGTVITLRPHGDEHANWFEDMNGYAVVRQGAEYRYAALDAAGNLTPSQAVVGQVDPQALGLQQGLHPTNLPAHQVGLPVPEGMGPQGVDGVDGGSGASGSPEGPSGVPASGTVKNLVVLCKFSDHTDGVHTRIQADYDTLWNAVGGHVSLAPTGSVKDAFTEMSYGTMTLDSTVVAWVTLPQNEAYYANGSNGTGGSFPNNAQGMCRDALNLVDALIDFGQFDTDNDGYIDAIAFMHSGYGAETGGGGGNWIWSHKWSLYQVSGTGWQSADLNGNSVNVKVYNYHTEPALWGTSGNNISRIGVAIHETGHFFGLPDLYDTDSSSRGIGSWCMMANSWGFNGTQMNPPHFSAWCKIQLGWVTPTVLSSSGNYTAPRVQTTAKIFRIDAGFPSNEYLLIENRQAYGFDSVIPQGGLAIWHIDDNLSNNRIEGYPGQSGWPTNGNHYKVALLQADGLYDLEKKLDSGDSGDLYHAGGVSAITGATTPSTDTYQGGTVTATYTQITNVSASGASMTFDYTVSGGPSPAAMTTPASNGATLSGASHGFVWSTGTSVTQYYLWIGSTAGSDNYYFGSQGTNTSATIGGLPTDASTVYVRLFSMISGAWQTNDYNYVAASGGGGSAKAAMTTPASNGATLSGASHGFVWSTGTGVTQYYLWIGSTAGSDNYYFGSQGTNTSGTIGGLPTDGSTVYVRLFSMISGAWQTNDYNYVAASGGGGSAKAAMTTPASSGATLSGASHGFVWSTGTGVTQYYLWIGSTAGSDNYYFGSQGSNTSANIGGLPTDGSTVYVRLFSMISGAWQYNDTNYVAASGGGSAKAAMTTPASNGATLSGASHGFVWSTGTGVTQYYLWIGSTAGSDNYYFGSQGTNTSATIGGLPTDGSTVYVRLFSMISGAWQYNDYNYVAASGGGSAKAAMTTPASNGATLSGASHGFVWSTGTGVTQYYLWIGSTAGSDNYYFGSQGANTSATIGGLPTDGSAVYVRLFSMISGAWQFNDYNYVAANVDPKAAMTTPASNGANLASGAGFTFGWSAGIGVTEYYVWVGTTAGSDDIFWGSNGSSLTRLIAGLPGDGSTIYVRLFSKINGAWQYNDYNYVSD